MGQKMTQSNNFLAPKKKAAKKAVFEAATVATRDLSCCNEEGRTEINWVRVVVRELYSDVH